jgi:hypothetical protein
LTVDDVKVTLPMLLKLVLSYLVVKHKFETKLLKSVAILKEKRIKGYVELTKFNKKYQSQTRKILGVEFDP